MSCLVLGSQVSCLPVSKDAVEQRACVLGLWGFFIPFIFSTHSSVLFTEGSSKLVKEL